MSAIAFTGHRGIDVDFKAFEIIFQDEIHNAGHRICTIDCGCAACEYFDSLNQLLGNRANINRRTPLDAADVTPTVNQCKGSIDAKIAQIEQVGAVRKAAVNRHLLR